MKRTDEPDWAALLRRDAPPPPDSTDAARTAALLRTLPPPRPTGWAFVWGPAGFIQKRMWAVQFAVLAGVLALVTALGGRETAFLRQYTLCAAAAPLLLVANVQELARVYHQGMLELELATRYSLAKVTAARLVLFGGCDAVLLAVVAAVGAVSCRAALWVVLLYCLTPFTVVSAVCLALLRRLRPAAFGRAALTVVAVAAGALLLPAHPVQRWLYAPTARPLWATVLAVSAAALAWQIRRLTQGGVRTTL